jgi:hypothetical protein
MNQINVNDYTSTDGMSTKVWGPHLWNFLFISIMGRYPFKIEKKNKEHKMIKHYFKNLLHSLQYIMPCVYCRDSYIQFYNELPIDSYLKGRIYLMYYVYLIKDKVNNKLIKQEILNYNKTKKKLKELYKKNKISKDTYYLKLSECKSKTFYVKPTPPFKEVLDKYEQYRAKCSKKTKSCSLLSSGLSRPLFGSVQDRKTERQVQN